MLELEERIRSWADSHEDVEPISGAELRARSQARSTSRRRRSQRLMAFAAVALVAALAAGLLASAARDTDDVDVVDEPETSSVLDAVPAGAIGISITDYAAARQRAGVGPVDPPGSPAASQQYLQALADVGADPREAISPGTPVPAESWEREFGVDVTQFEEVVVFGQMPDVVHVIRGSFDTVDAAVRADPTWSDILRDETYRGVSYYVWGVDELALDLPRATELRPLGAGGALAVVDDLLIRSRSVEGLESVIDVLRGEAPALTDDRVVRAVVDLVDPAVTSWFLGAPDENGVVVSGPTPSLPEESDAHVSALLPAGLKPEDATTQVNNALTDAGFDNAVVSVADRLVTVTVTGSDPQLMQRAIETVPGVLHEAINS